MCTLLSSLVIPYTDKLISPATLHATIIPFPHPQYTNTHLMPAYACLAAFCMLLALLGMSSTLSKDLSILEDKVHSLLLVNLSCPTFNFPLLCAANFLMSYISEIPPVALSLTVKSFRARQLCFMLGQEQRRC